ncbi:MAG: hypothetical protein ACRBK7_03230 [Acidimicrobiales bacterium]
MLEQFQRSFFPQLRTALPAIRIALAVGLVWFLADAVYEGSEEPEPYSIVALAPDPSPPTEADDSFDGFAGCSGYVPALPTDDCDGPPVPSNSATASTESPPSAPAAPEQTDDGIPIPFASTDTDTSETLAPPTVTQNVDGTTTIELSSLLSSDDPSDPEAEPATSIVFTGTAETGTWNSGASFEVPGTDIVLVPADVSAASTNSGGLSASVFGFEIVVAPAEDDEGVSVQFEGVEFEGEWSEETVCLACSGVPPEEGYEGDGTLAAGGVFLLPNGETVLVTGVGSGDEIIFPEIPDGAVYLATLIDLENDGVFDVAFIAPEGGIEIDLEDPTG